MMAQYHSPNDARELIASYVGRLVSPHAIADLDAQEIAGYIEESAEAAVIPEDYEAIERENVRLQTRISELELQLAGQKAKRRTRKKISTT